MNVLPRFASLGDGRSLDNQRGLWVGGTRRLSRRLLSSLVLLVLLSGLPARSQEKPTPALSVTPSNLVLLVGDTVELNAVDTSGRPVRNARWSVDYPLVEVAAIDAGVQLKGLRSGRALITVEVDNLSASATISVLAGTQLPATAIRWSLAPAPGYNTLAIRQAEPASDSEADIFSIEWSPSEGTIIRALRSTGQQLWSAHLSV